MGKVCTLLLAATLWQVLASFAHAQVRLDQYEPAPTVRDGFALSRPYAPGHLTWGAQLSLGYAKDPLVWEHELGVAETQVTRLVGDHLVGHASLALGVADRALFFVSLPATLWMDGTSAMGYAVDGLSLGDVALGTRAHVWGEQGDRFSIAGQGTLTLPTAGDDTMFSGEQTATGHLQALLEVHTERFATVLNLGARLRKAQRLSQAKTGHELTFGLGAGYDFLAGSSALTLMAELFGRTVYSEFARREETGLELVAGPKLALAQGFSLAAAGAAGLTQGLGTPVYRLIGQVGFAPAPDRDTDADGILDSRDACREVPEDRDGFEDEDGCPDPDNDHDGVLDTADRCPDTPEDADGFEDADGCPDPDNDGDEILDGDDACPLRAEDRDGFEDEDGCPDPDNDGDGVLDDRDGCPLEKEDADGFEDEDGCPDPDNDGDGLLDADDQCPLEPETVNGERDEDGCPDRIRVDAVRGKIIIFEPVQFASNRALILPESFPMLQEIAGVMKARKEIGLLAVEGHTDSRGRDARNQRLSEARAESVRDFLVEHGVAKERLSAQGFGETQPIDTNKTRAGRAKNRRVEFNIMPGEGAAGGSSAQ